MWVLVFFDLPTETKKDKRAYQLFRKQLQKDGIKDVDAVLTTRELGDLIKRSGIDFKRLPDEEFDQDLLGDYTGAGVIFGVTGGVI